MAINLWTLAGKPINYNPMPTNWVNLLYLNIGDYTIRFKAKSPTKSILWITGSNAKGISQKITLDTEFIEYEFDVTWTDRRYLAFYDNSSSEDIIVEDIVVTRKSTGKATINGIDGFLSGKWSIHANARVIDDETLELNAVGHSEISEIDISVVKGETYTISHQGDGKIWVKGSNILVTDRLKGSYTFKADTDTLRIVLYNHLLGSGRFIFKKPMLNLGANPVTYSKKTGDRMVKPSAKGRNIIDIESIFKHLYGDDYSEVIKDGRDSIRVTTHAKINSKTLLDSFKEGKQYTFSYDILHEGGSGVIFKFDYTDDTSFYMYTTQESGKWHKGLYTSKEGKTLKRLTATYSSGSAVSYIDRSTFQLEEGVKATKYEKYEASLNAHITDSNFDREIKGGGNGYNWAHAMRVYSPRLLESGEVKSIGEGTITYVLKNMRTQESKEKVFNLVEGVNNLDFNWFMEEGDFILGIKETSHVNISREDALTASDFPISNNDGSIAVLGGVSTGNLASRIEDAGVNANWYFLFNIKFKKVIDERKKGLFFDGVDDDLKLPLMTIDSIELDCYVEHSQGHNSHYYIDFRPILAGGLIHGTMVGSDIENVYIDDELIGGNYNLFPNNRRFKMRVNIPTTPVSASIFNLGSTSNGYRTKGVLYGIKCYLEGEIVAEYDFTNPNNIVGDKIVQDAKNLIPSFDSGEWNLHNNFRVLGKDVGILESTTSNQLSYVDVPVKPFTNYIVKIDNLLSANHRIYVYFDGVFESSFKSQIEVTTRAETKTIRVALFSYGSGAFDFINPQLYEVSSPATISGKPTQKLKTPKRTLFAER